MPEIPEVEAYKYIVNQKFSSVDRRGKYLIIVLRIKNEQITGQITIGT